MPLSITTPIIALSLLTSGATGASADSIHIQNPLDEVVVTATRTPKALKDVPVITRLIGNDELSHTDATNIQDLLTEEIPGLEFGYAMSQETALQMGGFGGNAVLFLVDGERLAGETMDNVDYSRLDLENASHVEIVKGAASALYGANAVGGVVNIISRRDTKPWSVSLDNRYRSLGDEYRAGASVSFNAGNVYSLTSGRFVKSNHVNLTDPFDTESVIHDLYGGHSLNLKQRLIYTPAPDWQFTLRGGYFDRTSQRITYDDRFHDYNGGIKCDWNPKDNSHAELSYSYDQYDKKRYIGGHPTDLHDYSDRQHIVRGLYSHIFGVNTLTAGADYMFDHLESYQFAETDGHYQHSADLFLQFDWNPISKLNIVGSLRDDWYSASHQNALTARLAIMSKLNPITLRAGYSGGFRAPTLKEMYMEFDMAGIRMIYGNPDLKPERSHNLSLSLERNGSVSHGGWFAGSYSITISGQYNFYESRITTEEINSPDSGLPALRYANEKHVRTIGADINLRYRSNTGLSVSASYNYLHTSGSTIESQFSQPRPHSATWRIDYDHRFSKNYKMYVGLSGRYLSHPDTHQPTGGAYSIWKLTLQQEISKGISLNLAIDNLFNYRPKVYYWNSAITTGIGFTTGLILDIDRIINR